MIPFVTLCAAWRAERAHRLARGTSAPRLSEDGLVKYSPDQPRVPAGNSDGGQWTTEGSDQIQVASNDNPLVPGGVTETPGSGIDPLDPKGLNTPPTPDEQQGIADTINKIQAGDVAGLQPHRYQNLPSEKTGAMLPPSAAGYISYTVPTDAEGRGEARILVDTSTGAMYYTANHYKSFIPVVTAPPTR